MLEESATVINIEQGQIWVVSASNSGCAGCMQKDSCSTTALTQVLRKKPVAVDSELALQVGDTVIVAIDETVLLRAAFVMYLLPLCALFIGAGIADGLTGDNLWIASSALISLALALLVIRKIQSLSVLNDYLRPIVIKKC